MNNEIVEKLKSGARRFHQDVYAGNADAYQFAATHPQQPHTLVITCADSRVEIESITSAGPGEVFIARNVGNMVPPYGDMLGGVSAVIEYAVSALKVKHVMVCGHSDCGAMKALLHPEATASLPTVRNWLTNGDAALQVTDALAPASGETPEARLRRLTEENVLMQLAHLKTHPSVAGALARGQLTLSGWVYDIGTGSLRVAEDGQRDFVPVSADAPQAVPA